MILQSHSWGIYLDKTTIQKDACTPVFIAALFTIARTCGTWAQPQLLSPRATTTTCPLTDEWIKKMWYIYNGLLLSHKKE